MVRMIRRLSDWRKPRMESVHISERITSTQRLAGHETVLGQDQSLDFSGFTGRWWPGEKPESPTTTPARHEV